MQLQAKIGNQSVIQLLKSLFHPVTKETGHAAGLPVNLDPALEKEADVMGDKAEGAVIQQKSKVKGQENNTGIPEGLKTGVESLSGMDLSDVKIHYNSNKPAALNALAYAQGTDIHIGPGQEEYLPHEAWHVVQQRQGRVSPSAGIQLKVSDNDNKLTLKALKKACPSFGTAIDTLLDESTAEKDSGALKTLLSSWDWTDGEMKKAYLLEIENKSHTLFRHGPHLGSGELDERITSNTIFGESAPAPSGSKKYATKFKDYEAINNMRKTSIDKLNDKKDDMIDVLEPKMTAFNETSVKLKKTEQDDPERITRLRDAQTKKRELFTALTPYLKNNEDTLVFRLQNVGGVPKAGDTENARSLYKFYDGYEIVADAGSTIGSGRKKSGDNPIEDMSPITKTYGYYKINWGKDYEGDKNKANKFKESDEVQLFPDNRPEGIHGKGFH
ncbi:MAG TPA: hypothetical protein DEF36_01195 [Desulfotomaculum sp.]|nr:hypothetical protein [Desulfotomaculum sp.]